MSILSEPVADSKGSFCEDSDECVNCMRSRTRGPAGDRIQGWSVRSAPLIEAEAAQTSWRCSLEPQLRIRLSAALLMVDVF